MWSQFSLSKVPPLTQVVETHQFACTLLVTCHSVSPPWAFTLLHLSDTSVSSTFHLWQPGFLGISPELSSFLSCNHSMICLHLNLLICSDYLCSPQPLLYSYNFSSSSLEWRWFNYLNQSHRRRKITKAYEELECLCGDLSLATIQGMKGKGVRPQAASYFVIAMIRNHSHCYNLPDIHALVIGTLYCAGFSHLREVSEQIPSPDKETPII